MQRTLMAYFNPDRWFAEGNKEGAPQVRMRAREKIHELLAQLDTEFRRHGGEWFMGDTFTALDPYVFIMCRWTPSFISHPA